MLQQQLSLCRKARQLGHCVPAITKQHYAAYAVNICNDEHPGAAFGGINLKNGVLVDQSDCRELFSNVLTISDRPAQLRIICDAAGSGCAITNIVNMTASGP
ncbi:hypothetical protein KQ933_02230 [Rhizobium sp. WYJ-E13]|nr:hypothetical protein KQ933_02230 [Rhizobium sp. WYJ-E13]